ncbi:metallophosphoesterase family protein [Leeuwenhoekiella aestuarii]|uniref:Calcineurin-like phosphoesterase family protein n=1 Tax=Leeuwenhoekiella aestuarii TaxID=2249426 RepID=A0A4Q0NVE8_9FLAO|nr:metallophosphoesterase [Leeuwenhoekiella aestuarii]RXG15246.1 calcineurin-like phosphoesterase family protein [Leeuwenhoekiella aestuarii]
MRLIHLSDIHLSSSNYHEFVHKYRHALISDLKIYNSSKKIDVLLITGDLVDKGGHSLLEIEGFDEYTNPFDIFNEVFIQPVIKELGISSEQVLFVPGNHDVNERNFSHYDECQLIDKIKETSIESYLKDNRTGFLHNERIQNFKEFEKSFHATNALYDFTNNHSTYLYNYGQSFKIGFILINDSWRCKTRKIQGENAKLFFGYQQLDYSLDYFESQNTDLNICLFHHSLDDYAEQKEVERILKSKEIELFLYGHYHNTEFKMSYSPFGSCIGIRGRAALNKPEESVSEYQSGYQIIDLDLNSYRVNQIHYRKYIYDSSRFDADTETAEGGIDENKQIFILERRNRKPKGFDLEREKFFKS